jgi:homoserine O-acetyltransferase
VLYPLEDQQRLHSLLPNSDFHVIKSMHGHDGFLLEQEQIEPIMRRFLLAQAADA